MSKEIHVVMYTDGSARPNPGYTGWGCHGYIHDNAITAVPKSKTHYCTNLGYVLKDSPLLTSPDFKVVEPIAYLDFLGPSTEMGSNNWAEISAVYEGMLGIMLAYPEPEYTIKSWLVFTDSEYVRKGLTEYLPIWKRNQWVKTDGSIVKNKDLWMKLDLLVQTMKDKQIRFDIKYIEAHKGHLGNTQADYLSVVAMQKSRRKASVGKPVYQFFSPKKYWREEKPESLLKRHPLITFKRIYFNSLMQHNYMGHYYQVESGTKGENKDTMNGKRTSDAAFAVVRLSTPDPIIELLKKKQIEACDGNNAVVAMLLDIISSKEVSGHLEQYAEDCVQVNPRNFNLEFLDRRVLCESLNPSNLTPRSIEMLNFLEKVLENIRAVKNEENIHDSRKIALQSTEITDIFYETSGKGKVSLRKEYGVGVRTASCDFSFIDGLGNTHHLRAPIALGLDMPERNTLAKLTSMSPRIHLVYWLDSATALSYAVYVECNSGYGLWANAFSNKIYVPVSSNAVQVSN